MTRQQDSHTKSGSQPTRASVIDLLLRESPISARDIAAKLGMGAAGVRRHLENLCAAGEAEVVSASRYAHRDRGRPARQFQLTSEGRERFGTDYKGLAKDALSELRTVAGDDAIRRFAQHRMQTIFEGIEPVPQDIDEQTLDDARLNTVTQIVNGFVKAGFATTIEHVGEGIQICQHHCPISAVAESCPELCTVEEETIEALLGTHVQRLSALSHGHRTCTTNIPLIGHAPPTRQCHPDADHNHHRDQDKNVPADEQTLLSPRMPRNKGFTNDTNR